MKLIKALFIFINGLLALLMFGSMWLTLSSAINMYRVGVCFSYQCTPTFGGTVMMLIATGVVFAMQIGGICLLVGNIKKIYRA